MVDGGGENENRRFPGAKTKRRMWTCTYVRSLGGNRNRERRRVGGSQTKRSVIPGPTAQLTVHLTAWETAVWQAEGRSRLGHNGAQVITPSMF